MEAQLSLNPGRNLYEESVGIIQACIELSAQPDGGATLTVTTVHGTALGETVWHVGLVQLYMVHME